MTANLIIVGSGGHAAVLADVLLDTGAKVLGCTDSDPARKGLQVCGLPVLGADEEVLEDFSPGQVWLVNGIGGTRGAALRQDVQRRLEAQGWRFATVRHRHSVVSARAELAAGVQLLAQSVVQVRARVGQGSIINTAAVVEHDCKLGEYVHVAPGAVLCGDVEIGDRSHVGARAVIRQGIRIGADTVIGAGAVVTRDFAGQGTLVGTPARQVQVRAQEQ